MLRGLVLGFGVLLTAGGCIGLLDGLRAAMIGPVTMGILVLAGTVFERGRYRKAETGLPGPGFERTAETFTDPSSSGEAVDVWYNQATGERRYVRRV